MPYKITEPASLKKFVPSPVIIPSLLYSKADDVTLWAKPVVGIIKPHFALTTKLSNLPIAVSKHAKNIIVNANHAQESALHHSAL